MITFMAALITVLMCGFGGWAFTSGYVGLSAVILGAGTYIVYQFGHLNALHTLYKDSDDRT